MTDQKLTPAPARTPFLRTGFGRATLVGGVLLALGAGAAVAGGGWGHRHGMMGGGMGRMGGGFERFCAMDAGFVTQKMADGLTLRLNLTDPQKASLADLRQTALGVATEAKKLCADKPDMTTTPGRLAAMQTRLTMAGTAMTTLKPKIEAFYATLDDAQKKQFDQMGPMGGKRGWKGQRMGGEGPMGMGGMQGMGGMGGMGGMAPRQ
jgi:hypothetical protein